MDLANGTHDYHLEKPISVHFKGIGSKDVTLLEMHEPSRAHVQKASRLKQMVSQALLEMSENSAEFSGHETKQLQYETDEEHAKESEGLFEAMKACLLLSKNVDLGDFVETFIAMATKNSKKELILCDGKVPISDIHFDQMSADEINNLALTYTSFFFMPAEMRENEQSVPLISQEARKGQ